MTPLEDYLDQEFYEAMERARVKFPQQREIFNGQAVGFMLTTAIGLACNSGCPKAVLQKAVSDCIQKHYQSS